MLVNNFCTFAVAEVSVTLQPYFFMAMVFNKSKGIEKLKTANHTYLNANVE